MWFECAFNGSWIRNTIKIIQDPEDSVESLESASVLNQFKPHCSVEMP